MDAILGTIHPHLRVRMLRVYEDVWKNVGYKMRATSGLRSMQDQKALWMKGRDEEGNIIHPKEVVTYAPPGSSFHNFGLACDSRFVGLDPYFTSLSLEGPEGEKEAQRRWNEFGRFVKLHGISWGGDWREKTDRPHAEMRFGMTLKQVQDIYKVGGLAGVWAKVDQIIKG